MQDGTPMPVMVTEVTDTAITLDANHPLAGLDLTFAIRLVEIV
jgi:peptidylprolyl isomerase